MKHFYVGFLLFFGTALTVCAQPKIAGGEYFSLLIRTNGSAQTLWAYGANDQGQLGLGNRTNRAVPVQVGSATDWKEIAAGQVYSLALKTNGSLWAWGQGDEYQLGNGIADDVTTPVAITPLVVYTKIAAHENHSAAIDNSGILYLWGTNDRGQCVGTANPKTAPTNISSSWKDVAVGAKHTIALRTDGTLWAWGDNLVGQLGIGSADASPHTTVTQIGTVNTWTAVAAAGNHSIALRADGTVWSWGYGDVGQLGQGGSNQENAPVQVSGVSNCVKISTGVNHTIALRPDGTAFAWGINSQFQFGAGFTQFQQVRNATLLSEATNWIDAAAGGAHTVVRRSTDQICAAGDNSFGQIGNGLGGNTGDVQPTFACSFNSTLPLSLLSFDGQLVSDAVQLKWKTENEINTESFIVERKIGSEDYSPIGVVASLNTAGAHNYSYVDRSVISLQPAVAYYRLKMIDIDGKTTYSSVVTVAFSSSAVSRLYPNPASDQVTLSVRVSSRETTMWFIRDMAGRTLLQGNLTLSPGATTIPIDISRIPAGMYIVTIQGKSLNDQLQLLKR